MDLFVEEQWGSKTGFRKSSLDEVIDWWSEVYPESVFPYLGEERENRDVGPWVVSIVREKLKLLRR